MFQKHRLSTTVDNELAEALKIASYADCIRQLDQYYGQGLYQHSSHQLRICLTIYSLLN